MTDTPDTPQTPQKTDKSDPAERIAKVMARAGVASRREAERMILEGRVTVNGKAIDSPALDVLPGDRITVDGNRLDEKQETRLWLYYKPVGLVTSESDEKGRQTVFDALPRDLPRVMTVGRLDLNSEGLLLLTNDGDLKRRLELPSTGWLRRYRVRVNGQPSDLTFAPLRRGVTIDGEEFAPMEIKLDSQQGANAWLTVGIREGRNREIRRAMAHVGLQVNRLIRVGYGPFKLTGMEKNEVIEVKRRVLRDQLGGLLTGEVIEKEREMRPRGAEAGARAPRTATSGLRRAPRPEGDGEGRPPRPFRSFAAGGAAGRGDARDERPTRKFGAGPAGSGDDRRDGRKEGGGRFGVAKGPRDDRGPGDRREGFERREGAGSGQKPSPKSGQKFGGKPSGGRGFSARKINDGDRDERSVSQERAGAGRTGGKPFSSGKPGDGRVSKGRAFGDRDVRGRDDRAAEGRGGEARAEAGNRQPFKGKTDRAGKEGADGKAARHSFSSKPGGPNAGSRSGGKPFAGSKGMGGAGPKGKPRSGAGGKPGGRPGDKPGGRSRG